jgi:hypothetical protein
MTSVSKFKPGNDLTTENADVISHLYIMCLLVQHGNRRVFKFGHYFEFRLTLIFRESSGGLVPFSLNPPIWGTK